MEIADKYYLPSDDKNKLRWVTFRLTHSCPLKCSYCNQKEIKNLIKEKNDIGWTDILKSISKVKAEKAMLNITGGEPLLIKALYEKEGILEYAKKYQFDVSINTSGMICNANVWKKILSYDNIKSIYISLDSINENYLLNNYGVSNLLFNIEKIIKMIIQQSKGKVKIYISSVIDNNNWNDYVDLLKYFENQYDGNYDFNPLELKDKENFSNSLKPEQLKTFKVKVQEYLDENKLHNKFSYLSSRIKKFGKVDYYVGANGNNGKFLLPEKCFTLQDSLYILPNAVSFNCTYLTEAYLAGLQKNHDVKEFEKFSINAKSQEILARDKWMLVMEKTGCFNRDICSEYCGPTVVDLNKKLE
ncbi:MAG: radical SAM protein [Bacteroidales bacterium]